MHVWYLGTSIIDLNFYSEVVVCSGTMAVLFVGVGMNIINHLYMDVCREWIIRENDTPEGTF